MIKSFEVTSEDLALINKYALRPLTKDEVFTFSVILCDNEIDRDFERFSHESLKSLRKLFIGKTGIFDHSMQSEDQSARVYRTELFTDRSQKTSDGRDYTFLKAWCYTVRSEKNDPLIRDIEAGIKKEVSVSCNSGGKICSVCGKDGCSHIAGRMYGEKLCYKTIEGVSDAYEWSFVAVPAQKNAGVTKSAKFKKEKNMENILKSVKECNTVTFEPSELKKLSDYIVSLERGSEDGRKYRQALENEARKSFSLALPSLAEESAEEIAKSLTTDGLLNLCKALKKQASSVIPTSSQLYREDGKADANTNQEFKF